MKIINVVDRLYRIKIIFMTIKQLDQLTNLNNINIY